jgi:hypothetical protein
MPKLEALQVNNLLSYIETSTSLFHRFSSMRLLGKTEYEISILCGQNQVPYQIFYDEEIYKEEEMPCVAKILIVGGKCIGSKFSN